MSALLTTQAPLVNPRPATDTPEPPEDKRLAWLFRGALRLGRIHPLYLPMLKYRQGKLDRG